MVYRYLVPLICFFPCVSYAQQTAPREDTAYNMTITYSELQTIGAALENLPFKFAAPLLQKLNAQRVEQDKERQVSKTEKPQ